MMCLKRQDGLYERSLTTIAAGQEYMPARHRTLQTSYNTFKILWDIPKNNKRVLPTDHNVSHMSCLLNFLICENSLNRYIDSLVHKTALGLFMVCL